MNQEWTTKRHKTRKTQQRNKKDGRNQDTRYGKHNKETKKMSVIS